MAALTLTVIQAAENTAVKAYAEVWGTDESGYQYAPVAWMEAMVDSYKSAGEDVITLMLHEDWVHNVRLALLARLFVCSVVGSPAVVVQAKVSAPFQLRKVWIQDRDWNVVMSERSSIFVDCSAIKSFKVDRTRRTVPVTDEMRVGPRPASMRNISRIQGQGTLVLVHGYCAGQNEFPRDQFTNAIQFQDYKQARSNDAFALKIREFGEQFDAFSIVRAHPTTSQPAPPKSTTRLAVDLTNAPFTFPPSSELFRSRTRRVVSPPLTSTATTGQSSRTPRVAASSSLSAAPTTALASPAPLPPSVKTPHPMAGCASLAHSVDRRRSNAPQAGSSVLAAVATTT